MAHVACRYVVCLVIAATHLYAGGRFLFAEEQPSQADAQSPDKWQGDYPALPIQKLTPEAFEAAWKVDAKFDQVPLGEVLKTLIARVDGWKAEVAFAPALEEKISLDVTGVSLLEAIELACRAAGYHPKYYCYDTEDPLFQERVERVENLPEDKKRDVDRQFLNHVHNGLDTTIELAPGMYPAVAGLTEEYPSVTFAGPVRVQLEQVLPHLPYAVGQVEISFTRLPIPGDVLRHGGQLFPVLPWKMTSFRSDSPDSVRIVGLTMGMGPQKGMLLSQSRNMRLMGLLQGVEKLDKLSGELTLQLPQEWTPIWIENPKPGKSHRKGAYEVEIREVSAEKFSYTFRWWAPLPMTNVGQFEQVRAFAFDAQGKLISPTDAFYQGRFLGFGDTIALSGKPALVAIVPVTKVEQITYDHRFENIPLSEHQQQPAKLEKLDYGDEKCPVSLELLGFAEGARNTVRMKLTNHSNKDIWELRSDVGVKGKLGNRAHTSTLFDNGIFYFYPITKTLISQPVVTAGQSKEVEHYLHQVPPQNAELEAVVRSIQFADGTEWKVPGEVSYQSVPFRDDLETD